jgi:hypothetical protein
MAMFVMGELKRWQMDPYPITTREMLVIAAKEVGKTVPGLSAFIGAQEAIFGAIEANRVKQMLDEVFRRLDELEKKSGKAQTFDEKACTVLLYSADQVRSDILAESKKREYGSATARYISKDADLNEVFEVLDCLRKLSADDLKLLYSFRIGEKLFENRLVAELAGYQRFEDPYMGQSKVRERMEKLYPSLMRLEGLGVLFLSYDRGSGG